jgi:thiol-disulfide isomerase/thioredoxin
MIKSSASTLLTLLFVALTPSILAEEEETKFPSNTPVIMLTEDNFDEETGLGNAYPHTTPYHSGRRPIKTPWFIYFYTPWCPACRRMVPIWEEIARRYQGSVNIAAIERSIVIL